MVVLNRSHSTLGPLRHLVVNGADGWRDEGVELIYVQAERRLTECAEAGRQCPTMMGGVIGDAPVLTARHFV